MLETARNHRESVHTEVKQHNLLRFLLGKEWYGINAKDVAEVIRCPRIFNIPHTPDHIIGVVNLGGEILTIIDIRRLLELPAAESSNGRYVVVIERQDVRVGIIADRVSDLVNMPDPAAGSSLLDIDSTASLIAGEAQLGEEVLAILNLDKLLELPEE